MLKDPVYLCCERLRAGAAQHEAGEAHECLSLWWVALNPHTEVQTGQNWALSCGSAARTSGTGHKRGPRSCPAHQEALLYGCWSTGTALIRTVEFPWRSAAPPGHGTWVALLGQGGTRGSPECPQS